MALIQCRNAWVEKSPKCFYWILRNLSGKQVSPVTMVERLIDINAFCKGSLLCSGGVEDAKGCCGGMSVTNAICAIKSDAKDSLKALYLQLFLSPAKVFPRKVGCFSCSSNMPSIFCLPYRVPEPSAVESMTSPLQAHAVERQQREQSRYAWTSLAAEVHPHAEDSPRQPARPR